MRSTNVRVVAVDGFEIFEELTTGIEKTSSLLRSPVAFLSDRQTKRCGRCEGTAAYPGQQHGSAFLPFAHARPSVTHASPAGKGTNLDSGRGRGSPGTEGNYTKDRINDSRSFWFDFLPFCRMGLLANVPLNDKVSLSYWVVNGTNQVEATNRFKDQPFGFTVRLNANLNWTLNYFPRTGTARPRLHKPSSNRGAAGFGLRCGSSGSEWSHTHL